jgi:hypothetical protein
MEVFTQRSTRGAQEEKSGELMATWTARVTELEAREERETRDSPVEGSTAYINGPPSSLVALFKGWSGSIPSLRALTEHRP